jgi:hypothetical protein
MRRLWKIRFRALTDPRCIRALSKVQQFRMKRKVTAGDTVTLSFDEQWMMRTKTIMTAIITGGEAPSKTSGNVPMTGVTYKVNDEAAIVALI